MNAIVLMAQKEGGELLLGARGLAWLLAVSMALSVFGLLLVSDTELSLLDNAQVVYDMTGTITALGALLAVVLGSDAIAGERERGSLVPLLLAPVPRLNILLGKIGGQVLAWVVMLLLAFPYLWAVGSTGQNLLQSVLVVGLLGTPLVLGFGFFAVGLSARSATAKSSLMVGLICLLVCASPLLLGPSLRQSAIGRAFDAMNPFSAVLNTYDAVIIDSQPITVHFLEIGLVVVWLGLTFWFAERSFRRTLG